MGSPLAPHPVGGSLAPGGPGLTLQTDMALVARAVARPDSGLEVRDRLWLKIVIPRAFIGENLHTFLRSLQLVEYCGFINVYLFKISRLVARFLTLAVVFIYMY